MFILYTKFYIYCIYLLFFFTIQNTLLKFLSMNVLDF